jgi:hypothetical protein
VPRRCWRYDRLPGQFDRTSTTGLHHCWWSDRSPQLSECLWNRSWRSDRHPGRSDRPTLRSFFVVCFIGFRCARRNDHDSAQASRGSGIPVQLTSPSGCAGVTVTTPTSAVTAGEGRTGGTFGQPSSDDHVGEMRLPTTDRQTHTIGHLVIATLSSAHLRPHRPR